MSTTAIHIGKQPLRAVQERRLKALLTELDGANPFYTAKLRGAGLRAVDLDRRGFCERFPFTTKAELVADQAAHPPFGSNLTYPLAHYSRFCQTSGSTGAPLRWLDTAESWSWMLDNWCEFYKAMGITAADRLFVAFSFGPFLGFWTAFEAAARLGCLCIPGGGQSTQGRLQSIHENGVSVLCCTPTYAIRLGEAAAEAGSAIAGVRRIVVAGEPGGSIPATRARIEELWPGARVIDHHGMTEIGPVSYQCPQQPELLYLLESAYLVEIIDPTTLQPAPAGSVGELVLTNLGRIGSPLLRYRTGDLVQASAAPRRAGDPVDIALAGGILGRTDDMVIVRGINVYPSAIEAVVRDFPDLAEYRVEIRQERAMTELALIIEPAAGCADPTALAIAIAEELRSRLTLRIPVAVAPAGSLPRFEMKAKRWVRV